MMFHVERWQSGCYEMFHVEQIGGCHKTVSRGTLIVNNS